MARLVNPLRFFCASAKLSKKCKTLECHLITSCWWVGISRVPTNGRQVLLNGAATASEFGNLYIRSMNSSVICLSSFNSGTADIAGLIRPKDKNPNVHARPITPPNTRNMLKAVLMAACINRAPPTLISHTKVAARAYLKISHKPWLTSHSMRRLRRCVFPIRQVYHLGLWGCTLRHVTAEIQIRTVPAGKRGNVLAHGYFSAG